MLSKQDNDSEPIKIKVTILSCDSHMIHILLLLLLSSPLKSYSRQQQHPIQSQCHSCTSSMPQQLTFKIINKIKIILMIIFTIIIALIVLLFTVSYLITLWRYASSKMCGSLNCFGVKTGLSLYFG